MKKNHIYKYFVFSFLWSFISLCLTVHAQENTKTNKSVTVHSVIVDEGGKPLKNVVVTDAKETVTAYTTDDGKFEIYVKNNSLLFIETLGYEEKIISVQDNTIPESITLKKIPFYQGEKEGILFPAGISETKRNTIGAVGVIKGEALHSYPDVLLSNMLQGKLSGLNVSMNAGGLASNPSSLSVRGNQRGGSNPIITIVDGMERPIDNLLPEEIESIEVLKDATAKITYGARAANGVLLITTKRGEKLKQIINIGLEYGYGQATRTPEYINSYDYALLYNQARKKDNLAPIYSTADIEGYQNSIGANDFRYPNVDFNDYFLNNSNNYHKLSLLFSGGDERTQYALITGYSGTDGLEKIGTKPEYNRLNMRGNLNVKINDLISGFIGLALQYDRTSRSSLDHNSVYQAISSTRPNEYPLIIDEGIIRSDTTGLPALGASFTNPDNLYGSLQYGGYSRNQNLNGQTNFGLEFNLSKYLKGLSAKAYLSFDNSFFGVESLSTSAATYAQRYIKKTDGTDSLLLTQLKKTNLTDDVRLSNTFNQRTSGWFANINYNYGSENHTLKFDLSNIRLQHEFTGSSQDIKSVNYILRGNYVYGNKYIVEGDLSYMGSSKFTGDNKYQLFYAGGLGWILSEEDFFKTLAQEKINYFKIKTSLGLLGYDASTIYHLFQNRWLNHGTFQFNNGNNTNKIRLDVVGNPALRWEKSRQL
ncbi:MAG: TonB-dependent receptor plug domain-containing protein, partial [Parabacteroides sp.]|nr:TonB-dependent receptor plug domain-containing protein [Parabacteroides sp.]